MDTYYYIYIYIYLLTSHQPPQKIYHPPRHPTRTTGRQSHHITPTPNDTHTQDHWSPISWDGVEGDHYREQGFSRPWTRCSSYMIGILFAFGWVRPRVCVVLHDWHPLRLRIRKAACLLWV